MLSCAGVQNQAAGLQVDILSRTDSRICSETDMRENLAFAVATLQGYIHDAKGDVEDQRYYS
jgi:hypothetical protein